ncbi:hypothetical protein C809_00816 [Lachnospiraceae bacterium MD335]|nr:hypothetical protein C809_00816 [Lachnospiraceae bacterium MD335]
MCGVMKTCPICGGEVCLAHKGTRDDELTDVY